MGLWSRLAGLFKRTNDNADALLWDGNVFSVPSLTGIQINQQTALSGTAVLAATTMLAEDVAKLPWSLFRGNEDKSRVEAKDHWLYELIHAPNLWQNGFEFREQMMIGLVLRGNAYAVIARDGRGRPIKLIPVNPDWVALWEAPTGDLFYRVTPSGLHLMAELRDQPFLIPFEDMFHVRGFSMNGLLGASRIALAREAIALALAQEQTSARWMGQGARPSGMFTTDGKLSKDAAERISTDLKAYFGGLQNAGKIMLLEQGLKWETMSMTAQEAEFIAGRQFQLAEIARIFRIPPHMLGELSRSTNNNIEKQAQEYINYTLTGYTRRWIEKFSSTFDLRRQGLFIEFDYSELTRADITTRYNNYRTGVMSMVITPDEARLDDGRAPMGGDAAKLQHPANMAAGGSQSTGTQADGGGRPKDGTTPDGGEPGRARLEAMERKLDLLLERFNEDQPRAPNGQFGSGGGGEGGGDEKTGGESAAKDTEEKAGLHERVAKAIEDAKAFIEGKSASEVISAIAANHKVQEAATEALSFGLQSLVSHGTMFLSSIAPDLASQGLDASTWHLNEQVIGSTVAHFATVAQITARQARDVMKSAVDGLISLRTAQAQNRRAAEDENEQDDVIGLLEAVSAALGNLSEEAIEEQK